MYVFFMYIFLCISPTLVQISLTGQEIQCGAGKGLELTYGLVSLFPLKSRIGTETSSERVECHNNCSAGYKESAIDWR